MLFLGISLLPIGMYQVPLSLVLQSGTSGTLSVKGQSDLLRRFSVFKPYMLLLLYCLAL